MIERSRYGTRLSGAPTSQMSYSEVLVRNFVAEGPFQEIGRVTAKELQENLAQERILNVLLKEEKDQAGIVLAHKHRRLQLKTILTRIEKQIYPFRMPDCVHVGSNADHEGSVPENVRSADPKAKAKIFLRRAEEHGLQGDRWLDYFVRDIFRIDKVSSYLMT